MGLEKPYGRYVAVMRPTTRSWSLTTAFPISTNDAASSPNGINHIVAMDFLDSCAHAHVILPPMWISCGWSRHTHFLTRPSPILLRSPFGIHTAALKWSVLKPALAASPEGLSCSRERRCLTLKRSSSSAGIGTSLMACAGIVWR